MFSLNVYLFPYYSCKCVWNAQIFLFKKVGRESRDCRLATNTTCALWIIRAGFGWIIILSYWATCILEKHFIQAIVSLQFLQVAGILALSHHLSQNRSQNNSIIWHEILTKGQICAGNSANMNDCPDFNRHIHTSEHIIAIIEYEKVEQWKPLQFRWYMFILQCTAHAETDKTHTNSQPHTNDNSPL